MSGAASAAQLAAAFRAASADLDGEVAKYVAGMIVDERPDTTDAMVALVGPFLEASGADAATVCAAVVASLSAGGGRKSKGRTRRGGQGAKGRKRGPRSKAPASVDLEPHAAIAKPATTAPQSRPADASPPAGGEAEAGDAPAPPQAGTGRKSGKRAGKQVAGKRAAPAPLPKNATKLERVVHALATAAPSVDRESLEYVATAAVDTYALAGKDARTELESLCSAYLDVPEPQVQAACDGVLRVLQRPTTGKRGSAAPPPVPAAHGAGGAGAGSTGKPLKLLRAPVKLGATAEANPIGGVMMDYMWGNENNAYLRANKGMVLSEKEQRRVDKRRARAEKRHQDQAAAVVKKQEAVETKVDAVYMEDPAASTRRGKNKPTPRDVHVDDFDLLMAGKTLLDCAQLRLVHGRRYGIVGRNGCGKTTLLKAIARHEIDGFPRGLRVLHVAQEIQGDNTPVLTAVVESDSRLQQLFAKERDLLSRMEDEEPAAPAADASQADAPEGDADAPTAGAAEVAGAGTDASVANAPEGDAAATAPVEPTAKPTAEPAAAPAKSKEDQAALARELNAVYQQMEQLEAHSAEARASELLAGLGFTPQMQAAPTSSLSGGWRMRVALACALFLKPDLCLLDEPTNHLDLPAVMWLEDYLQTYENTLVVVSHDRYFLTEVATDVIHFWGGKLTYYGDYASFVATKEERHKLQQRQYEAQLMKRQHMQEFIDKFRFNAKRASLVQSRIKALAKLPELEPPPTAESKWNFSFPDPEDIGRPVLQVDGVGFTYKPGAPLLFDNVSFGIDTASRIGLLGANGVGKSTLLKLMLDELEPVHGRIVRNRKLRVGHFTQHHMDSLDVRRSPLEEVLATFPGSKPDQVRRHLGRFGLSGELALQTIATLSGGQKSRVAFAILSWRKPHLLLCDEPTNHLDADTIDSFIDALKVWQGGVVVVSHDQYFLSAVCTELWHVRPGHVDRFTGNFKQYKQLCLDDAASRAKERRREAALEKKRNKRAKKAAATSEGEAVEAVSAQ